MNIAKYHTFAICIFILINLASCGGGGGSGGGNGNVSDGNNIVISSIVPSEADSGALITLDASNTASTKSADLKYLWYLRDNNSGAMLFDKNSPIAHLRAPITSSESMISVTLSVEDDTGAKEDIDYSIKITPYIPEEIVINTKSVYIDLTNSNIPNFVTPGKYNTNPNTTISSGIDTVSIDGQNLYIDVIANKQQHFFVIENIDTGVSIPALKIINENTDKITFNSIDIILGYAYQVPGIYNIDGTYLSEMITDKYFDPIYGGAVFSRTIQDLVAQLDNMLAEHDPVDAFQLDKAFDKYQSFRSDLYGINNGIHPWTGEPVGELITMDSYYIEDLALNEYSAATNISDSERATIGMVMGLYIPLTLITHDILYDYKSRFAQRGSAYPSDVADTDNGLYLRQYDSDGPYSFRITNDYNSIYAVEIDNQYIGLIGAEENGHWESDPYTYSFNSGDNDYLVRILNGLGGSNSGTASDEALSANLLYIVCKGIDALLFCPFSAETISQSYNIVSGDPFFISLKNDVFGGAYYVNSIKTGKTFLEIGVDIIKYAQKHPKGATTFFTKLGMTNIVEKILEKSSNKLLIGALENVVAPGLKIYNMYELIKFGHSMFTAPTDIKICAIVDEDGQLLIDDDQLSETVGAPVTCKINHPPEPAISITSVIPGSATPLSENIYEVSPGAGVFLDAGGTKDDRTSIDELLFEWADGNKVQAYSNDSTFGTTAQVEGDTTVTLKVKDEYSEVGIATITLRAANTPFDILEPKNNDQLSFDGRHPVKVKADIENFFQLSIYFNNQIVAQFDTKNETDIYDTYFFPQDIVGVSPGSSYVLKAVGINRGGIKFEDSVEISIVEREQPTPHQPGSIYFIEEIESYDTTYQGPFDPTNPTPTYDLVSELYEYIITPTTNHISLSSGIPTISTIGELGTDITRQGYNSNFEVVNTWSDGLRRLKIDLRVSEINNHEIISMPQDGYIGQPYLSLITREEFNGSGSYTLLVESDGVSGYSDPSVSLAPVNSSTISTVGCDSGNGSAINGQIDVANFSYLSGTDRNSMLYHYSVDFDLFLDCTTEMNVLGGNVTNTTRIEGTIEGLQGIGVENYIPLNQ